MKRLLLTGRWTLRNQKRGIKITAPLPGDTHSALLAARKIPDPYDGTNELDVQWVGREDWEYVRTVDVPASWLHEKSVFLHADGLDTIAEIRVNGRCVGRSTNMFQRVRCEIKQALRPGANEISILFRSAEMAAIAAAKRLPYPIPFGSNPVQSPHRNLIRKVQCHSGWDWGCCLMVAGANGGLWLGATSTARIEYVYTEQRHRRGACEVDVFCEAFSPAGGKTELTVAIGRERSVRTVTLKPGGNVLRTRLTVKRPALWWPNGYGKQPLYDLTVTLGGDEVRKRLGLRTLELVTEEDKAGLGMKFRVNGKDIFCKGANWIPCDALPQRESRARLDDLLSSAAAAHMNMLRVWGGGKYESEDFYELCDEKGILIWQDMMFACALYPADAAFLESVREEVRHQAKRLRDHACLALWCGNNENVGALNWFKESREQRDRYLVDYDRLNEGAIGNTLDVCDPTHRFWPSSPCGGRGDYSDCFHSDGRGDMHYWGVWHEGKAFDAYYDVKPRFCSEFGYQSFPSLDTIRTYAPPDQWNVTAPGMEHHQRNVGGNSRITEMFTRYFRVPEGFANFVYLSQVQQGLAIQTAVEYWRSLRPRCMGAIYWQLDDNWPVCSWSSLEYGGKWKLLHYMARRFFAPVNVCAIQRKETGIEIWAVNDRLAKVRLPVTLEVRDFAGRLLKRQRLSTSLGSGASKRLCRCRPEELLAKPDHGFLRILWNADGKRMQNVHFLCEYKRCTLPRAKIGLAVRAQGPGFVVALRTDRPAFFVSLNADGIRGEFDDNCIALVPGETRTLRFQPKQKVTLAAFRRALRVSDLRSTYR